MNVNTGMASGITITGQLTEMSQRKKTGNRYDKTIYDIYLQVTKRKTVICSV